MLARWLLDVSVCVIRLAFAVASPQPLTLAHCFKTLGSDRFGGLLGCWVVGCWFLNFSADMFAGSLASGY